MRQRIHPYIKTSTHMRLSAAAAKAGTNVSKIVDAAVAAYLSKDFDDERDAALIRRLDRHQRQLSRIELQQHVLAETLALAIRYYLTIAPEIPAIDKQSAIASGALRFENFIDQVRDALDGKSRFIEQALEEIRPEAGEFFSAKELDKLRGVQHV